MVRSNDSRTLSEEHSAFAWVTKEEALSGDYNLKPGMEEAIRALIT